MFALAGMAGASPPAANLIKLFSFQESKYALFLIIHVIDGRVWLNKMQYMRIGRLFSLILAPRHDLFMETLFHHVKQVA